jgi:isochorismate hydrolase
MCCRHTAYDAFVRGFDIIVPEDAVDAFTEDDHRSGLDYMKRVYGVNITKVSNIIRNL